MTEVKCSFCGKSLGDGTYHLRERSILCKNCFLATGNIDYIPDYIKKEGEK